MHPRTAESACTHGVTVGRQLVGLITRRPVVRILPSLSERRPQGRLFCISPDPEQKTLLVVGLPFTADNCIPVRGDKTLIPVTNRIRKRFGINSFCVVADRGMISADTIQELEGSHIPCILGTRMRRVNEIKFDVLSRGGRYSEVYPEGVTSKDPAPLKVKQVLHNEKRYIVCLNSRQARKDAGDRDAILASLKEQLKKGPKSLVGNKGYHKYLKIDKDSASVDMDKVKYEARFDGKWVLTTNTDLPTEKVALKYKELWQVERLFRDVKSLLETRPVYHQRDENIRGHVFCSFLALVLRKELERRLNQAGHLFEWSDIKQDLKALQQVTIEENGKYFAIRSECKGHCGKIFQAVKVAIPPTIREVS